MKTLARCLGAIALVLAVLFAYLVAGAHLQVSITNEEAVPAAEYAELFAQTMERMRSGEFADRQFRAAPSEDISDYVFIVTDLSVGSFGLLPCEWLRAGVTPLEGDIVLAYNDLPDIPPLGRAKAQVFLLAEAGSARTGHGVWIEYYAYGVPMTADAKVRPRAGT